jgi:hypothetical protein
MVTWLGTFYKIAIAVSPAVFVLVLTIVISFVAGHPEGPFLTRSTRGIPVRFVVLTILLAAPILALPRLPTFLRARVRSSLMRGRTESVEISGEISKRVIMS